jgi:hypothetical protein
MLRTYPASQKSRSARPVQRHPRVLYSIPVTLHRLASDGVQSAHGISLDISESGIGALLEGRLEVGETVGIDVPLPDLLVSTAAVVRYTSSARSGFEFLGLTPVERERIASLVGTA